PLWIRVCLNIPSASLIRAAPGSHSLCFEVCYPRTDRADSYSDKRKQEAASVFMIAAEISYWAPTLSRFLLRKDARALNRITGNGSLIPLEILSRSSR